MYASPYDNSTAQDNPNLPLLIHESLWICFLLPLPFIRPGVIAHIEKQIAQNLDNGEAFRYERYVMTVLDRFSRCDKCHLGHSYGSVGVLA